MQVYVAMLRGINVSGQKIIKMEQLRASFETLGFDQVDTYVQSGNVIFGASKTPLDQLLKKIKGKILSDFGFSVALILRTSEELKKIVDNNPFLKDSETDRSKLHVTFMSQPPSTFNLGKLAGLKSDSDRFHVQGREVYLYCPNGYGRTKLSNTAIEKLLAVEATTRNWRTVITLAEMSSE